MEARSSATIRNREGLHVKPATLILQLANRFPCAITLRIGGTTVNAKSAIEILGVAPAGRMGATVEVRAEGEGAQEAALAVAELIESGFGETLGQDAGPSRRPPPPSAPAGPR